MQIDAPEGYTAKMLKRDMLTYLNMNACRVPSYHAAVGCTHSLG